MDIRVPTRRVIRRGAAGRPRGWLLPLVLVVALAQAGCGSETESREPRQGLSNTQFREIERLYRVQVETERMADDGQHRRALEKTAKACASVDDSDPLLEAVVNGCGEMTRFALSLANDEECDSASDCAEMLRVTATEADDLVDTMRRDRRTIRDLLGNTRCSEAVAGPHEFIDTFETLGGGLRGMATAIESRDEALLNQATEALEQAEKDLDGAPSATALLERFRAACA